jgi:hypothetical protein
MTFIIVIVTAVKNLKSYDSNIASRLALLVGRVSFNWRFLSKISVHLCACYISGPPYFNWFLNLNISGGMQVIKAFDHSIFSSPTLKTFLSVPRAQTQFAYVPVMLHTKFRFMQNYRQNYIKANFNLYILDSRQEDTMFCPRWYQSLPQFDLPFVHVSYAKFKFHVCV